MTDKELDKAFNDAVERINNHENPFPADFLLRLYAYYKKASQSKEPPKSKKAIITAFKANALFQIENISEKEAKEKYIEQVNSYFKK